MMFRGLGRLVDWGDGFAVIYDGINQPDGVIAFDSQMEVAWQAEVTGASLSRSPHDRLADGSLIVWGRSEPLTHLTIRVSLDSGRVEWEKRTDLFHAEPVPLGDVAVAWTYNNEVIGIDLETGAIAWTKPKAGPVGGDAHRVDGTLVVPRYRGSIVGVNPKGRFKFVWPVEGNVTGVVAVVEEVALVTTYVDDDVSRLRAIDLTDGAELWSETVDWQSQVAVTQSFAVVFEVRDRGLAAVDLRSGDRRWDHQVDEVDVQGTVSVEDRTYATIRQGRDRWDLVAVDGASGGDVMWEANLPGDIQIPPISVGELIVVGGLPEAWSSQDLGAPGQGWLHAYDAATGELVWQTVLRDPPREVIVRDQDLLVLAEDPRLVCD